MKIVERKHYIEKMLRLRRTPDIKVVTGIRRSGKSVLMQEFAKRLELIEENMNLVIINLQELEFDFLLDYHALHEYILSKYIEGKYNVLIVDEIQLCKKFEYAINSIHSKSLYDIYITGSNAFLLSSDLATLFTGRTMEIKVLPFSFREYLDYYQVDGDYESAFEEYFMIGGMSGSYLYEKQEDKTEYVRDVYKTVIMRDLVNKYKIVNIAEFNSIAEFMMDNIGNIISPNNVCNVLNKNGSKITRKTVSKYIDYLEKAFLMYEVKRYDLRGKKYLRNNNKYYLSDIAFRYAINGSRNMDYGRAYENIVYLELLRRGYELYVGKLYENEIDFVAQKGNERIYIQVSDNISDEKTFEREYKPLLKIRDAYTKMIIARTRHGDTQYDGIQVKNIVNWLAEE